MQQGFQRMALGVSYSGTGWQGWQTQMHGLTVQDTLEKALSLFLAKPVATICAGRTDTGVHALQQVIHCDTDVSRSDESWVRGVNAYLPESIAVRWAKPVSQDFHARFSALKRSYVYVLYENKVMSPLCAGKAGWSFRSLDVEAMQQAAQFLVGEHDFSSFRASSCQAHSPIRTLSVLDVERRGSFIYFYFTANAFLHHMVRNIVGALVYVGQGKKTVSWIQETLAVKNRIYAAPTFSPDGLYLTNVVYPDFFQIPQISFRDEWGI